MITSCFCRPNPKVRLFQGSGMIENQGPPLMLLKTGKKQVLVRP